MKKYILTFLIIISGLSAQSFRENIDQFKSNSFVRPASRDSIEILSFIEVPYSALQFVKKDNVFESGYEADIAIIDSKDEKMSSKLFSDKITVKKFGDTTSKIKRQILVNSFTLPTKNYIVKTTLKDLDIKLSAKKEQRIDLEDLNKRSSFQIYNPIFVKDQKGTWGLGENKFPTSSKRVIVENDLISFYQYAVLEPGAYTLTLSIMVDKKAQWTNIVDGVSSEGIVSHYIEVPLKDFDTRNMKLKVVLSQNNNTSSKSFPFKIKNPILFDGVDNIDKALDQMRYIMTTEEKKELRALKQSEKEKFFRKLWAKRDPVVKTKTNELLVEYYTRVAFAEENFSRGTSGGWKSDMGMIYILFGKPDDVVRSMNMQGSYNYETWSYFQIGEEFTFIDENGFGDYRLRQPRGAMSY